MRWWSAFKRSINSLLKSSTKETIIDMVSEPADLFLSNANQVNIR
jgi:hypothetical protein